MAPGDHPSPRVSPTPIPGLLVLRLALRSDARGSFKENWQRDAMVRAGLPDFGPVQHNVSVSRRRGVLRGLHAEPWDKLVSVATGRVFGAWVDLRAGPTFGTVLTHEIGPADAVFVPRGVANGFQVLEDGTAYTYLVNDHWRPDLTYLEVNALDPALGIRWPVDPLDRATGPPAEMSDKDRTNPLLADVEPFPPARTLVIGTGQLGRALVRGLPAADQVGRTEVDLADPGSVLAFDFSPYAVVVNAAGHSRVDEAETPHGRVEAWAVNARGPAALALASGRHGFTLVHYSTDYVFDGTREEHDEGEPVSPLGVYGQSKAAGEMAVTALPRHYLLRTSWLVGDGANFVRTMQAHARDGVRPSVVDDQRGRLTFADELSRATRHLLDSGAAPGTYHATNGGAVRSWADYARAVFAACGRDPDEVIPISTEEHARSRSGGTPPAPRPRRSAMALDKLEATGFVPADADAALAAYLSRDL